MPIIKTTQLTDSHTLPKLKLPSTFSPKTFLIMGKLYRYSLELSQIFELCFVYFTQTSYHYTEFEQLQILSLSHYFSFCLAQLKTLKYKSDFYSLTVFTLILTTSDCTYYFNCSKLSVTLVSLLTITGDNIVVSVKIVK